MAEEEYEEVQKKRKFLEKKLESNSISDVKVREMMKETQDTIFQVDIDVESSSLVTNGFVVVKYFISATDGQRLPLSVWKESADILCLVCGSIRSLSPGDTSGKSPDRLLYPEKEEICYETFEFTEEPIWISDIESKHHRSDNDVVGKTSITGRYVGKLKISLPSFAGVFHVSYNRVVDIPMTSPTNIKLAQTNEFSVKAPILNATPDSKFIHQSDPKILNSRRRGCKPITDAFAEAESDHYNNLCCVWEDLKNIKTYNFTFSVTSLNKESKVDFNFNRTMAWIYNEEGIGTKLIVETDLITSTFDRAIESTTIYLIVYGRDSHWNIGQLNLAESYIAIDGMGSMVCRIPYKSDYVSITSTSAFEDIKEDFTTLSCKFCSNPLLKTTIYSFKQLPTGMFDNVIEINV